MPPRAQPTPNTETAIVALAVLAIAAFLAFRQWVEIQGREPILDDTDRDHFRWKDLRRFLGAILMAVVASLMLAATRIDPHTSPAQGRAWGWIWIAVLILIVGLLTLAFFDWRANTRYAVRHRRALLAEQRDYFASLKRPARPIPPAGSNGHTQGPSPPQPSAH
jgi:hypothetical protein